MTDPIQRRNPTMRRFRYFDDRDEGLAADWLRSLVSGAGQMAGDAAAPFLNQMSGPSVSLGPALQSGLETLAGPPSALSQAHQPIGLGSPPQPRMNVNMPDMGIVGDMASDAYQGAVGAANIFNAPLKQAWESLKGGVRGLGSGLESMTPEPAGPHLSAAALAPQPLPQASPYMEGAPRPRVSFAGATGGSSGFIPAGQAPPQPPPQIALPQVMSGGGGPRNVPIPQAPMVGAPEPMQSFAPPEPQPEPQSFGPPDPMMTEGVPGRYVDPRAREAMLQAFPLESPFTERPVESYFTDAALEERMKKAQRYALAQALLGFGAGMLGGEDLQSGLSQGFSNVSQPLAHLQQQREELPLEYAKTRYEIESDRENRGFRRSADERAGAAEAREAGRYSWEIPSLQRRAQIEEYEVGNIESGYAARLDNLKQIALENQNNKDVAEIEALKKRTAREEELHPQEKRLIDARIGEMESQSGVNRANEEAIRSGERYGDSGSGGVKGLMPEASAYSNMQKEFDAYQQSDDFEDGLSPEQHMARIYRRMMWKVGGLDEQTLKRMGGDDLDDAVAIYAASQNGTLNELLTDPVVGPQIRSNKTLMELIALLRSPQVAPRQ